MNRLVRTVLSGVGLLALTGVAPLIVCPTAVAQRPVGGAYAQSAPGLPFEADFIETLVPPADRQNPRPLATHGKIARDSAGRTMRVTENDRDTAHIRRVWVNDPVAQLTIQWDSATPIAVVTRYLNAPDAQKITGNYHKTLPTPGYCNGRPRTELGRKSFDGLDAVGCTLSIEVTANANGVAPAYTQTIEDWTLVKLNLEVKTVTTDSYNGVRTWQLGNIVTTEPDEALFKVPADYTVREVDAPQNFGVPNRPNTLIKQIGGSVSAPVIIYQPEPNFPEEARGKKMAGNVLVYLQVDTNGLPTNVRVLRGLGHGFDEKAVEAVKRYKFKPAMENGQPVTIQMNVEINFQVF